MLYPLIDACWGRYGRAQAAATATATPELQCEMLVVAPLSRAIETGLLAFPNVGKVVAHEAVREYAAKRYANKRRTRTELQALFGDRVDFTMIDSDEDPLFNPDEAEPWPAGPVTRYSSYTLQHLHAQLLATTWQIALGLL